MYLKDGTVIVYNREQSMVHYRDIVGVRAAVVDEGIGVVWDAALDRKTLTPLGKMECMKRSGTSRSGSRSRTTRSGRTARGCSETSTTSIPWLDSAPRRPRLSSTHRASCSKALAAIAGFAHGAPGTTGLRHIAPGARF